MNGIFMDSNPQNINGKPYSSTGFQVPNKFTKNSNNRSNLKATTDDANQGPPAKSRPSLGAASCESSSLVGDWFYLGKPVCFFWL